MCLPGTRKNRPPRGSDSHLHTALIGEDGYTAEKCPPVMCRLQKLLHHDTHVVLLYLTLCNTVDCSLPGTSVHGISEAKTLEWVAISYRLDPRIKPESPALQVDALTTAPPG